ncbi:MAG: trypsin-like peptidase domain-containing protein [Acetobacteraceae bacterium]|nr:trypsin-like peptidase domain-containing protein [Acetobacteraceae bacterium]
MDGDRLDSGWARGGGRPGWGWGPRQAHLLVLALVAGLIGAIVGGALVAGVGLHWLEASGWSHAGGQVALTAGGGATTGPGVPGGDASGAGALAGGAAAGGASASGPGAVASGSPAWPGETAAPAAGPAGFYWPAVEVARTLGPTVVGISTLSEVYDWWGGRTYTVETSSGTGVVFDAAGLIVTNFHVVEGAVRGGRLQVSLADGRRLDGTVVGYDRATDLAVVRVSAGGPLPAAVLGDSDRLQVGELAVAMGNPVGREFMRTVTVGVISGLNRTIQQGDREFELIQTDAAINPGNSGGPLANVRGEVVGINTIKLVIQGVENMGFAIPSNTVRRVVADIAQYGRVMRPWLGVTVTEGEAAARYLRHPLAYGLYVVEVYPGHPAARAGIKGGDILVSLGGTPVNSIDDLERVLAQSRVGQSLSVVVERGGRRLTLTVVLGEMPAQLPG